MLTLELQARQAVTSPAVYLDHWALMDIAQEEEAARRFAAALHRRGGTLCLSWLNLVEFTGVSDPGTTAAVELLLRAVIPQVAFIEINPVVVIEREDALLQGGPPEGPHLDFQLLKFFVALRRTSPNPFDPMGFIDVMREPEMRDPIRRSWPPLIEALRATVDEARNHYKGNPPLQRRMGAVPSGPPIPAPTRYIYQDVVRWLIRDKIDMNGHHWRDIFHTVVPLAYMDLLLLDGTWASKANEVCRRLKRAGILTQSAQVFSKKTLDAFWRTLEA